MIRHDSRTRRRGWTEALLSWVEVDASSLAESATLMTASVHAPIQTMKVPSYRDTSYYV